MTITHFEPYVEPDPVRPEHTLPEDMKLVHKFISGIVIIDCLVFLFWFV